MIESFHRTVATGNQNTYKFALGRAILEEFGAERRIPIRKIASRCADYYYRNHHVFKLRETSNPGQEPAAIQILRKLIKYRYGESGAPKRISKKFRDDFAEKLLIPPPGWGHSIFTYVLPCWQGAHKNDRGYYDYPRVGSNDFFDYSINDGMIELSPEFAKTIGLHRSTLISLVVLEWASFLEKFNQTPNLISKLKTEKPLRRLSKFRKIFLATPDLEPGVCHLCGCLLTENEFSLDHVVPFDYVYSDELWNLVPAHRSCNSKKGARVGSARMICSLAERNGSLWDLSGSSAQKWIQSYAESAGLLEKMLLSSAESAMKAGFSRVNDQDFFRWK